MKRVIRKVPALHWSGGFGSVAKLVPLLLGSVLVSLLAAAAAPSSGEWFFQSPVSPLGPSPTGSPAVPEGTVPGPGLVSVPAPVNFLPWLIGILVVGAIVAAVLFWRRDKGERGGDA